MHVLHHGCRVLSGACLHEKCYLHKCLQLPKSQVPTLTTGSSLIAYGSPMQDPLKLMEFPTAHGEGCLEAELEERAVYQIRLPGNTPRGSRNGTMF